MKISILKMKQKLKEQEQPHSILDQISFLQVKKPTVKKQNQKKNRNREKETTFLSTVFQYF